MFRFLFLVIPALLAAQPASSQALVMNGLYDCQRATNGRPYCKKQGAPYSSPYVPVNEEFFGAYENARTGRQTTVNVQSNLQVTNNILVIQLKSETLDLKGQNDVLELVIVEQKALLAKGDVAGVIKDTVSALEERLAELRTVYTQKKEKLASAASSSIRPDDAELGMTARKSSEVFPKVPFFIPGTREVGEFWVEPVISDTGALFFKLKFVDANSAAADKVRSVLELSAEHLERLEKGLIKVATSSKLAHEKKVRRSLDVRLDCFPTQDCPDEGKKVEGKSSTELLFQINEDGSTSGRIQRNKGRFEEGYNFSVKTALLFQAYIHHVLASGRTELEVGSASNEDLKALFR